MRVALAVLPLLLATPSLAQTPPAQLEAAPGAVIGSALNVSNIGKAAHFYVDGLGMSVNMSMGPPSRRETMLGFGGNRATSQIILLTDTTAANPAPIEHGHGFDRIVLRMANLQMVSDRLKAAGFVPGPIHDVAMGYRMMMVTDPDGYKLELVESRTPH